MYLLKYRSPRTCGIIAVTFTLSVCLNLVITDGISVENEISRHETADYISKDLSWDYAEGSQYYDESERRSSKILSRKRRYLTFPSGSSFQLVYDLIIGVVDFTNYLILGVTSALAWQLPTEAPSELAQHLRDKLTDGTLGTSRNDTIENIEYVDTKPKQNSQNSTFTTSFSNPSFIKSQSPSYSYYTNNQFHPPMDTKYYSPSPSPVYYSNPNNVLSRQDTNYYSTRRNPLNEWKESKIRKVSPSSAAPSPASALSSKLSQWWNSNNNKGSYRKPVYARKHRIFPVFAKRSVDKHNRQKRHGIEGTTLTKIDQIHLRYHRSTRQELYLRIEKYLETHNKNGQQCVLKALCETGQKGNEEEPGTFVGEIMRSIFTIPESEDPVHNYRHKIYDDAHAHGGNCTEKYPQCVDSLWKADFIL